MYAISIGKTSIFTFSKTKLNIFYQGNEGKHYKKMQNIISNKLRVGALNCQGLRDKVDLSNFLQLINDADIFGISETWLREKENDISLPGFNFKHMPRKASKGPARGGVGVFVRNEIKKHVKIKRDISNENFLWCKISKGYLGYHDDLYLCFVYIPPECSTREKRININHFKRLQETLSKINGENIILMGDFNARTQLTDDNLLRDGEHDLPNYFFSDIISKRCNQDLGINNYGKKLTDLCIATKSYIVNGRTLGDFQGKLTCYEEKGASTVDYTIASEQMHRHIVKFQVLDPTHSDHCPIILELHSRNKLQKDVGIKKSFPTIRWTDKTKQAFFTKLESNDTQYTLREIDNLLDASGDIDKIVDKISEIYNVIEKNPKKDKPKKKITTKPKKWYDKSCFELANKLKNIAKLVSNSPKNPHLRGSLCKTRKEYRKLLKLKRKEWKTQMVHQLEKIIGNL